MRQIVHKTDERFAFGPVSCNEVKDFFKKRVGGRNVVHSGSPLKVA